MRILLIDNALDTHSERFLSLLLNSGHQVGHVTNKPRQLFSIRGYHHFPYPSLPQLNNVRPYSFGKFLRDTFSGKELRRISRAFKPDVVHVLLISANAYHCVVSGLQPLILTAFGSDINDLFDSKQNDLLLKRRISRTLQFANCVTADTREILQRCDILAGRKLATNLFYFGINLELFHPISEAERVKVKNDLGIPLSANVIFSPRRIIPKMRHETVLTAFANLVHKSGSDAFLIFRKYGSYSSDYQAALDSQVHQFGVVDRVLWLEQTDYENLPALYGISDVIVNMPEQDGLPVALFEASACKVPVITSQLPSYKEFLCQGAYFEVPVGDEQMLLQMIKFIFDDHDGQIAKSVQKNRALIEQVADIRNSRPAIENIYTRVISRDQ